VRRIGRYEVVTYPNAGVPDVIVHAAADKKPTSSISRQPTGSSASGHVTSDDVTVQSPAAPAGVWTGPADDDRKLSTCGSGASSSLPQLSVASGRQQSALDKTGSNNLSLSALHAAAHVDAASQRQTLIRSHACRPCHDLSKVARFGSHFRLSAAVADVSNGSDWTATPDDLDRSSLLQNIIVCDRDTRRPGAEVPRPPDSGPQTARRAAVDGESRTGRTLASRAGLAVLGGVRAWWSKSDETTQSRADCWQEPVIVCGRRRSAQEQISIALTRVSLVSCDFLLDK